jgi:hypothetical protein
MVVTFWDFLRLFDAFIVASLRFIMPDNYLGTGKSFFALSIKIIFSLYTVAGTSTGVYVTWAGSNSWSKSFGKRRKELWLFS